jgi:transposase-like protein
MPAAKEFTPAQKAEIVLSVFSRQLTAAEASRVHGITESELASWRADALEGRRRVLVQAIGTPVWREVRIASPAFADTGQARVRSRPRSVAARSLRAQPKRPDRTTTKPGGSEP